MISSVKLISLIMAMAATTALAATGDPGETAIAFLEKVRAGKIDLAPGKDTALVAHVSPSKRQEITRRLERIARDLADDPLEVSEVKLDNELGAVLVHKTGSYDPSRMQVFPVAMIKRGENWIPTPVPASFENTGMGYAASLRKRLDALEDWMLRQQAVDLDTMRSEAADRMRREIEKTLSAETLRAFTPLQACTEFLRACEQKSLPAILALLGGMSSTQPDDWALRIKAADTAVNKDSLTKRPWRLLVSEEVLRIVISQEADEKSAMFSIGCLDPSSGNTRSKLPKIEFVHLDMTKSPDDFWRINPPSAFILGETERPLGNDEAIDLDLRKTFSSEIAKLYPPTPLASAQLANEAVIAALQNGSLKSLMKLIDHDTDAVRANQACILAAHTWWQFHGTSLSRSALPLDFKNEDSAAAAIIQIFASGNPDRFTPLILYYQKSADGWLWNPNPNAKTEKQFQKWQTAAVDRWKNKWQNHLLRECAILTELPKSTELTDDALRTLVNALLASMSSGNAEDALRHTARLDARDSASTLLRNLGYEITGAARNGGKAEIMEIYRGDLWAAVGTRSAPAGKPVFHLYPIINTPEGPRVMLEIDLIESGSRSRDFLNKTAIDRLAKIHPDAAKDLKNLLATHREKVTEKTDP